MATNPQDIEGRSYQPVDLRGGLDLTSSKFNVQPGTLQDVLNYEASDQGYTRSQGLLFYDGTWDQAIEDMWLITTDDSESTLTGDDFQVGEAVHWNSQRDTGVLVFWKSVGSSPAVLSMGLTNIQGTPPTNSASIKGVTSGAQLVLNASLAIAPSNLTEAAGSSTIAGYLSTINDDVNAGIAGQVHVAGSSNSYHGKIPGVGAITGGFQFKDDVYAVRDFYNISFGSAELGQTGQGDLTVGDRLVVWTPGGSVSLVLGEVLDNDSIWSFGFTSGQFKFEAPQGLSENTWITATAYALHDLLTHNGIEYIATSAHTSAASTEPGIGASWATWWDVHDILNLETLSFNGIWISGDTIQLSTVGTSNTPIGGGLLWKATPQGWTAVDMGHSLRFCGGENAPSIRDAPLFLSNQLSSVRDEGAKDWTSVGNLGGNAEWKSWTAAASGATSDNTYATCNMLTGQKTSQLQGALDLTSILSPTVRILGIEVAVESRFTGVGAPNYYKVRLAHTQSDGPWDMSESRATSQVLTGTDVITTFGSSTDLWGVDEILAQDILDNFVKVRVQFENNSGSTGQAEVDNVKVTIHYVPQTEHVYFYDGTSDVGEAEITSLQITNGFDFTPDVEIPEVLATADLELTGGGAGSVDSVTVNGIELLDGVVAYNTSLTQTATDVATAIGNGNSQYTAIAASAIITITAPVGTGDAPNGLILDGSTTTITTFSTDFAGGVDFEAEPTKASGLFTIYNSTVAEGLITPGLDMYTRANGGGFKIAAVESAPVYNTLPSENDMLEASSSYGTIIANFFADEGAESIYGVTGAGHAFSFNGDFFSFIHTPILQSADKPRHVEFHVNMLALGYDTGHVLLSTVGAPNDFSAANGGTSWGFRDKITGLQSSVGTVLTVLTTSTTGSLEGTDPSSMTQKNIQPTSGAREYTLKQIIEPFFMDFYGLNSLSTTSKFGDFSFGRASSHISPWLRDRLQRPASNDIVDRTPVGALSVRNKNHYRLFFNDGYILTASFFTDRNIEFTWQHYDTASFSDTYVPTFLNSFVLESGRERLMMGTADGSVYIIDGANGVQTGSGLTEMDAYIIINPVNMGRPETVTKYHHTVVQGQFYGWQQLEAWAATNYVFDEVGSAQATTNIGASTNATQLDSTNDLYSIYLPILADGYSLKLQTSVDGSKPHTLQSLLLRASLKGTDRTSTSKAY